MPYEDRLRKSDWTVEPCSHKQALALVEKWHYAKGMSNTAIFCHGLYDVLGDLKGCAVWLCPTQRACRTVDPDNWKAVVALSRLVVTPDVPKNACTFLIAKSVDLIRRDGRYRSLVSFADTAQGHTGRIYRAAGWTYMGVTAATPYWVDPKTGKMRSIKANANKTKQQMFDLGWEFRGRHVKHKFVRYLDRNLYRRFCEL